MSRLPSRRSAGHPKGQVEHARPPELTSEQLDKIIAAAEEAHSASTRRAYKGAWDAFVTWTEDQGFEHLPAAPETVALYLTERADAGLSRATLAIARAAIGHVHREAGHADPAAHEGTRRVLRGLNRRISAVRPQKQATGLNAAHLAAIKATAHLPRSGPTGQTESKESAEDLRRVEGVEPLPLLPVAEGTDAVGYAARNGTRLARTLAKTTLHCNRTALA